jgi:hypothetical protein
MPIKSTVLRCLVISSTFQLACSVGTAGVSTHAGAQPPGFGTPVALQPAVGNAFGPLMSMASDGTNFLLAAEQFPGAAPVAPSNTPPSLVGTLLAPSGLVLSRIFLSRPSVGLAGQQLIFDGTNYVFAGAAGTASGAGEFISQTGVLFDGPEGGDGGTSAAFGFSSNGSGNLLVTAGSGVITSSGAYAPADVAYSVTISGSGPLGGGEIAGTLGSGPFVLASDGTNYLCLCGVGATLLNGEGLLLQSAPLPLVTVPDGGTEALAFGGGGYLVLWTQASATQGLTTIAAIRLTSAGVPIDTTAIAVTADPANVSNIGASFFDGQFWIVWQAGNPSAVYAARVSPAGVVASSGTDGMLVATSAANPILTTNANSGFLAWNSIDASGITGVQVQSISPIQ